MLAFHSVVFFIPSLGKPSFSIFKENIPKILYIPSFNLLNKAI